MLFSWYCLSVYRKKLWFLLLFAIYFFIVVFSAFNFYICFSKLCLSFPKSVMDFSKATIFYCPDCSVCLNLDCNYLIYLLFNFAYSLNLLIWLLSSLIFDFNYSFSLRSWDDSGGWSCTLGLGSIGFLGNKLSLSYTFNFWFGFSPTSSGSNKFSTYDYSKLSTFYSGNTLPLLDYCLSATFDDKLISLLWASFG